MYILKHLLYYTFILCIYLYSTLGFCQIDNTKINYTNQFLVPYYITSAGYDSSRLKDVTNKFLSADFCNFFKEQDQSINGVLGENYFRLQIHFDTIYKVDMSTYQIKGEIKARDTISVIDGEIKVLSILFDEFVGGDQEIPNRTYCTTLILECNFNSYFNQTPTGQFKGVQQTILNLDTLTNRFGFYYGNNTDYYMNNTFVGVWQNEHNKETEKCIWGIGLLPFQFTGDFQIWETGVTDKYRQNGWKEYGKLNDIGLYIENDDKWWE